MNRGMTGPSGATGYATGYGGSGTYFSGATGPGCPVGPSGSDPPENLLERAIPHCTKFSLVTRTSPVGSIYLAVSKVGEPFWERKICHIRDEKIAWHGVEKSAFLESLNVAKRLCFEVYQQEVFAQSNNPLWEVIVQDSFWQDYVNDIRGMDVVAEVLLT